MNNIVPTFSDVVPGGPPGSSANPVGSAESRLGRKVRVKNVVWSILIP